MEAPKNRPIKIAIVGAGLIGRERLLAILALANKNFPCACVGVYDAEVNAAKLLADEYHIPHCLTLDEITATTPDWIMICIPHDEALALTEHFLTLNIKVLIEKPLGRSVKEAKRLIAASKNDQQLWVGFNYRFYAGIQQLYRDLKRGIFGDIISITMQLGHGGRPGDEYSWKLNPIRAGGGSLLDPGIHLFDLVHCFNDNTPEVISVTTWNGFWQTGIEEEAHILMKCGKTIINLSVSLLRWRSTFKIEVNGTEGYGVVSGRNRSYGNQTYLRGKRWGWQKALSQAESEEIVVESNGESVFTDELEQLFFPNKKEFLPPCNAKEALKAAKLWEKCLAKLSESSLQGEVV